MKATRKVARQRKQRKREEALGPQPYREARRRGLHFTVLGTANILRSIADANFKSMLDGQDYNAFSPQELEHVRKAHSEVQMATRRLAAVARRLQ